MRSYSRLSVARHRHQAISLGRVGRAVGKNRKKQAMSSSTAFVGCGKPGSVHR